MIEREIEASLVRRIKAMGLDGVRVRGLWEPAEAGTVKGEEGREAACITVCVSPKQFESFGLCEVSMAVTLELAVRIDMDPTGGTVPEVWERLAALLEEWNMAETGADLADFAVEGFDPGGVQVSGGEGPAFDGGAWTVSQGLTLRGTVPHGAHT